MAWFGPLLAGGAELLSGGGAAALAGNIDFTLSAALDSSSLTSLTGSTTFTLSMTGDFPVGGGGATSRPRIFGCGSTCSYHLP